MSNYYNEGFKKGSGQDEKAWGAGKAGCNRSNKNSTKKQKHIINLAEYTSGPKKA